MTTTTADGQWLAEVNVLRVYSDAGICRGRTSRQLAEKVSTRVRVRPKFEAALELCRQIAAHAPQCRVILTVYEMKRLGRDSAELTALADHLTAHGIALEMLSGPVPGICDPTGTGRILFAFFAAMAETECENIREAILKGLNAAACSAAARTANPSRTSVRT